MTKILVLGAGYAGMMTAARLDEIKEPFTLVNQNDYHYFTTLLHEAAGGRGEISNYKVPIKQIVHHMSSTVIKDEIISLNTDKRLAIGKEAEYPYDYLVYSLGWVPEYFGIPGLEDHSLVIRSLDTAEHIRMHIEHQFVSYLSDGDESHLRIAVGGAGLTGIEFVGELLSWLPSLCLRLGIDSNKFDVQNIEAMPSILPQLSSGLREVAMKTLTERGAKLRINTKITSVERGEVHLEGGESVQAGTIIWTGGVRANPLLSEAGFTVDRRGRAKVNMYLQSVDDDRTFVAGDSAWADDDAGKPYPPTAQVASQMGKLIADNISSAVHGQPLKSFHASLKGTLASLGPEYGVGDMFGLPVRGVVAGLAKEATKVKYLMDLGGARLAMQKSGDIVQL